MMVIPKSSNAKHVRENHAALDIHLSESDLAEFDHAFPEPKGPRPLKFL